MVLVLYRNGICMLLLCCWFGLGMPCYFWYWNSISIVLVWCIGMAYWYCYAIGMALVWHWYVMVLVWYSYGICMVLVCYWYSIGIALVW